MYIKSSNPDAICDNGKASFNVLIASPCESKYLSSNIKKRKHNRAHVVSKYPTL